MSATLSHPCVEQSSLVFLCPHGNGVDGEKEPILQSGSFGVKCKVCGLPADAPIDTNAAPGEIAATVQFGPNTLDGVVDESGILSYSVFMVDECNKRIGDALATVEVVPGLPQGGCCQSDAYTVAVAAQLPFNTTGASLMIVAETSAGLLSVGAVTGFVADDASGSSGAGSGASSAASSAGGRLARPWMAAWAVVACLAGQAASAVPPG